MTLFSSLNFTILIKKSEKRRFCDKEKVWRTKVFLMRTKMEKMFKIHLEFSRCLWYDIVV